MLGNKSATIFGSAKSFIDLGNGKYSVTGLTDGSSFSVIATQNKKVTNVLSTGVTETLAHYTLQFAYESSTGAVISERRELWVSPTISDADFASALSAIAGAFHTATDAAILRAGGR